MSDTNRNEYQSTESTQNTASHADDRLYSTDDTPISGDSRNEDTNAKENVGEILTENQYTQTEEETIAHPGSEDSNAQRRTASQTRPGSVSDEEMQINFLEKELENARAQTLRALADGENIRKRALREREDAAKYAISAFSRDLLSVADNLSRALASIPSELVESDDRIKNLYGGIEATEKELERTFIRHGIKKIEPAGEIFDPNLHEVMFEIPVEGKEAGTIVEIVQPGYMIKDRLLRPARVGVVKAAAGDESSSSTAASQPGHTVDTQV